MKKYKWILMICVLLFVTSFPIEAKQGNIDFSTSKGSMSVSKQELDILNEYKNGNTDKYILQRKEIVSQINAYSYVDDQYFITDRYYDDYDSISMLIPLQAAILIPPDFTYEESLNGIQFYSLTPTVTYFWESSIVSIKTQYGTLTMNGGLWEVDGKRAFCGNANLSPPRLRYSLNQPIDVSSNENLRKIMYYGYLCPRRSYFSFC